MASFELTGSKGSEEVENDAKNLPSSFSDSTFSLLINSVDLDVPLTDDDFVYSMAHDKIGKCYIFNHTEYHQELKAPRRHGSDHDANRLEHLFKDLQFETKTFKNHTYDEIIRDLSEVSRAGFDDYSCFVCCIMTHGYRNGILYAYDKEYDINDIWTPFRSDKCPTLVGKPKIFIIQACRGGEQNFGQKVSFQESKDSGDVDQLESEDIDDGLYFIPLIPVYTDFLTAYATYEGYYSFRNSEGTYFIRRFCDELKKNYKNLDLISILTIVNHTIAYEFISKNENAREKNKLKQMPCFDSSLTKLVKFP